MNPTKWENLIYLVEERFGIDKKYSEDFEVAETSAGEKIIGQKEIVEFKGPLGRIKLEKISRPRVIDKKVLHTKRIGGKTAVDFVYSNSEPVVELKIYKEEVNGEWEEISPETMGLV